MLPTGLIMKLLENRLIVPLGRLSYAVFLVNILVMMISQSTKRLPNYGSSEYLVRQNKFCSMITLKLKNIHNNCLVRIVKLTLILYFFSIRYLYTIY